MAATGSPGTARRLAGLAILGGYLDTACYLGLGGAFPANQTGNTVLLIMAAERREAPHAAMRGLALLGFLVGVAAASGWLANRREERVRLERFRSALRLELFFLAGLGGFGWTLAGGRFAWIPLTFAGLAMGVQSVAVIGLGLRGVTATYISGTYVAFIHALMAAAGRERPPRALGLAPRLWLWELGRVLASYALGCAAGGALEPRLGRLAFVLPAAWLAVLVWS